MYYIGMRSRDDIDIIESEVYNDEVKELLEYFYGEYYSVLFAISGDEIQIKSIYRESVQGLIRQWKSELSWCRDNKEEYERNLNRLIELVNDTV
nr:hypothetical protein [Paenibacillus xylanexedens]